MSMLALPRIRLHYVIWLTLRLLGHKVVLLAYAPLAGFIAMTQGGSVSNFLAELGCLLVLHHLSNSLALAIAPRRMRHGARDKLLKAPSLPPPQLVTVTVRRDHAPTHSANICQPTREL